MAHINFPRISNKLMFVLSFLCEPFSLFKDFKLRRIFFSLIIFYISLPNPISAQKNILRNGGFEEHGRQSCLNCNTTNGQYASIVYHWDNGGWNCRLCDEDYKPNSEERTWKVCPFDRISPHSGKAMISMVYNPRMNGIYYGVEGASHLSARTTEPMRVGQLYEISFWMYIEGAKRLDPDWPKHFGIVILPQNLSFFGSDKSLFLPYISADTVIYDQWFKTKWRVRPLCTSNYLMIGVFAEEPWLKSRGFEEVKYFLDDVSVIAMEEVSAVADSSVYYCSRYDPLVLGATPLMDNLILLYENDAYELTDRHWVLLDSFAMYANENPTLIFELSGHTDSIGSDNLALSQKRVNHLYQYLQEVSKLPAHRFYTNAMSGEAPFRPNDTEEGRMLNRRSEIRQSDIRLSSMCYRYALEAIEKNKIPEAFSYLDKWMSNAEKGSLMLLFFDPRLDPLRADKRWPLMENKVRNGYKRLKYARESFLIDSLRFDACRLSGGDLSSMLNLLPAYIPGSPDYELNLPSGSVLEVKQRYQAHYNTLRAILDKTGWPQKGKFSESAVNNMFHVLQNTGDIVAYLKWLPVLERACEAGELPWIMYAICFDKSRIGLGKPQRYVTQCDYLISGQIIIPPWEGDAETVNDFRAKIGLPLLSDKVVAVMNVKE